MNFINLTQKEKNNVFGGGFANLTISCILTDKDGKKIEFEQYPPDTFSENDAKSLVYYHETAPMNFISLQDKNPGSFIYCCDSCA